MVELNIAKILTEQERDLAGAEKILFSSIHEGLAETQNQVNILKVQLTEEIINPLITAYRETKDKDIKSFLKILQMIFVRFNFKMNKAQNYFVIGLGKLYNTGNYYKYFSNISLPSIPDLAPPKYDIRKIAKEEDVKIITTSPLPKSQNRKIFPLSGLSGLGAIPVIIFKAIVVDVFIGKIMELPFVQETIKTVLGKLFELHTTVWYLFNPVDKQRADVIQKRASYLENVSTHAQKGFDKIISAIEYLQSKVETNLNAFVTKMEIKERAEMHRTEKTAEKVVVPPREDYAPYRIIPKAIKTDIKTSTSRGVGIRYEREYLSGDHPISESGFSVLQYAMLTFNKTEDFPYAK